MSNYYWNDWYSGWGWFLWFGIFLLFFSSMGNWGYTYQAHRKYGEGGNKKTALDLLNERLVRSELNEVEYARIKKHILSEVSLPHRTEPIVT